MKKWVMTQRTDPESEVTPPVKRAELSISLANRQSDPKQGSTHRSSDQFAPNPANAPGSQAARRGDRETGTNEVEMDSAAAPKFSSVLLDSLSNLEGANGQDAETKEHQRTHPNRYSDPQMERKDGHHLTVNTGPNRMSPSQSDTNIYYSAESSPVTTSFGPDFMDASLFTPSPSGFERQTSGDSPLGPVSTEQVVAKVMEMLASSEYLTKSVSWSSRLLPEEKARFTMRSRARNDVIWELFLGERNYLGMLVMLQQVYHANFPREMGSPDDLLPCLLELIGVHSSLFHALLKLHFEGEDFVVPRLGPALLKQLSGRRLDNFARMYGRVLFKQRRIKEKLQAYKKNPAFLQYLQTCERDKTCQRRTLEDCNTIITQRWTKVETLLVEIAKNTTEDLEEAESVEEARSRVRSLLHRAEEILGRQLNAEQLRLFAHRLDVTRDPDTEALRGEMLRPGQELIYHGCVRHQGRRETKIKFNNCQAVMLKDMFFLLQETPDSSKSAPKYQLFKDGSFPPIIHFCKTYGYFREHMSKNQTEFGFFIILERPETAMLYLMCDTPDDRTRWKKFLFEGFASCHDTSHETVELRLSEAENRLAEKWSRTDESLSAIATLDQVLEDDWRRRTVLMECLLRDVETEPDAWFLSTDLLKDSGQHFEEWMARFQEQVLRLKVLLGTGSNLSRSTSSMDEKKKPASGIRKIESFSGYDAEKRVSASDSIKSEGKQKQNYRRLSANLGKLFRVNSSSNLRSTDKSNGSISGSTDKLPTVATDDAMTSSATSHLESEDTLIDGATQMETSCDSPVFGSFNLSHTQDGVISLDCINKAAAQLCNTSIGLHRKLLEAEATIRRLEEEKASLTSLRRGLASQNASSYGQGTGLANEESGLKGNDVRLENEKLRQRYKEFEREKLEWEKDLRRQRAGLDRSKEDVAAEKARLAKDRSDLEAKQRQFEQNCLVLQRQIDLHSQRLDIQLELDPTLTAELPNHQRSHSDDATRFSLSGKPPSGANRSSSSVALTPMNQGALAPRRHTATLPRTFVTPVATSTEREVPEHLQYSLVNQEKRGMTTASSVDNLLDRALDTHDSPRRGSTAGSQEDPTIKAATLGDQRATSMGDLLAPSMTPHNSGFRPSALGRLKNSGRKSEPVKALPLGPTSSLPMKLAESTSKSKTKSKNKFSFLGSKS